MQNVSGIRVVDTFMTHMCMQNIVILFYLLFYAFQVQRRNARNLERLRVTRITLQGTRFELTKN